MMFARTCTAQASGSHRIKMRTRDVPQDECLFEGWREICYAVDDCGQYAPVPSVGWEPANVANIQAWDSIREDLAEAVRRFQAGTASPLLYHMHNNLMDVRLLARYVGMTRWRVKRHMRPEAFRRLKPAVLERYARALGVSLEDVQRVPATLNNDGGQDE